MRTLPNKIKKIAAGFILTLPKGKSLLRNIMNSKHRFRYFTDVLNLLRGKKPLLDKLEFQVTDHCNLKCRGCSHFSNLVDDEVFYDVEQFRKDITRLSELLRIKTISVLGGEPLLNPDLAEIIDIIKTAFPNDTEIQIITNGLLLERMSDKLISTIREKGVTLLISQYKPTLKRISHIDDFLQSHMLSYRLTGSVEGGSFNKFKNLKGNSNPQWALKVCGRSDCTFMSPNHISRCGFPYFVKYFNKYFNYDITQEDLINIHDEKLTGIKLKAMLLKPMRICSYCTEPVEFEWERQAQNKVSVDDWCVEVPVEKVRE